MMRTEPVVIGVAGGSASGKTTVVARIVESLGDDHVTVLEHDRYYRDRSELRLEDRAALNYDHPDALETDLLVQHLTDLRGGRGIELPVYDYATYTRRQVTEPIRPRRAIIVEGILIFADAALRELMDVKVFVDTDDDIRFIRRLKRDVEERGRTTDSIVNQYLTSVRPGHEQYIEPSKHHADVVIQQGGLNPAAFDVLLARVRELTRLTT